MKKILVWGTGVKSIEFFENEVNANVVGFIETCKKQNEFKGISVYGIDELWPDYDYVVVANTYSSEIYEECIDRGFNINKFIFLYPLMRQVGETNPEVLKDILKERNYTMYCIQYGRYGESFFQDDLDEYQRKNVRDNFHINEENLWPIICDKYSKAGTMGNYFLQDLWAAKLINRTGAKKHFDIGSRIDGFIGHLLAMDIDVTLIDIREFPGEIEGLHTIVDDATTLRAIPEESIESMSALCSLEHFGLGRYGDPIDPEACFICFEEIQKRIKGGGNLYISLPIGKERVEFNAHRIFYASTVIDYFYERDLVEYSCVTADRIDYNVDIHKYDQDEHNGNYRYGLFHFVKK